jgi:uncharacterized protein YcbK (DUF882 family)
MISSHAVRRVGIAAFALVVGTLGLRHAVAVGDTRTISLHHVHTGEDLTITYKKNGEYDQAALNKINWIMRDWRKNRAIKMDPQEIDLLWEVYQEVGAKEPIYIICGYRSPATNEMLRRRSRHSGVARYSQHMLGKAIDFYIPGVPLDKLRATAMRLQGGGVGYYPVSGSPFVHLDVGNVRAWPRMTREQLVKLFPNGRTAHIPSDGKPLPGYRLALADLERRGHHRTPAEPKKRSLIAALFGTGREIEETEDNAALSQDTATSSDATAKPATPKVAPERTVVAMATKPAPVNTPVPLPHARPMYQIASAESRPAPVPVARPAAPVTLASLTPNQIIDARGYWPVPPEARAEATTTGASPALSISAARRRLASSLTAAAGQDLTATVGPFSRPDRVPTEVALAYAAQPDTSSFRPVRNAPPPAVVTRKGTASIAVKPAETAPRRNAATVALRLNNPWLRGVMLVASMKNAMTVTRFGDPDFARLVGYMHKPDSTVVMTFSHDPHLGMTAEAFSGSAVVFQATVTFNPQRTASLQ